MKIGTKDKRQITKDWLSYFPEFKEYKPMGEQQLRQLMNMNTLKATESQLQKYKLANFPDFQSNV